MGLLPELSLAIPDAAVHAPWTSRRCHQTPSISEGGGGTGLGIDQSNARTPALAAAVTSHWLRCGPDLSEFQLECKGRRTRKPVLSLIEWFPSHWRRGQKWDELIKHFGGLESNRLALEL